MKYEQPVHEPGYPDILKKASGYNFNDKREMTSRQQDFQTSTLRAQDPRTSRHLKTLFNEYESKIQIENQCRFI